MKGRKGKGPPSTDLLVCFPSRAHLKLMPKPICSPARPTEPNKRQHNHHQHHHHLKKSSNRNGVAGQASPILWAKNKPMSKEIDEPTSPKVTCAGQIKVKPKASSCKNWESVMEEIERLHNKSKHKKRPSWVEALGFKKDVMQFLTCLRNIRFDFRCFGAFPSTAIASDDEEDVDEDDNHEYHQDHQDHVSRESASEDSENSKTVFSKWFMVLQENNSTTNNKVIKDKFSYDDAEKESVDEASSAPPTPPPPNALLLMRCRSAPAKSWLEEKEEEEEEDDDDDEESHDDDDDEEESHDDDDDEDEKRSKLAMEEEKKRKDNLVVMRCGTDFYKFSSDIAKETWVVGGIRDSLSRSRSWKR